MKSLFLFVLFLISFSSLSFVDAEISNVQIDLHYENGDRVPAYEMFFIIYPDNAEPFRIIPSEIPAKLALEDDHIYNAELFVNDMFIEGFRIDLISENSEEFEITVPTPSGLSFSVFYDDGRTIVEDATISVASHTGFEWRNLKTAYDGKTYRTWIQSTTHESDYYTATVYLTEKIFHISDKITLEPGTSQTMKITTSWPTEIDYLKIKLIDSNGNLIKKSKNHFVQLIQDETVIKETKVPHFGTALFDLIELGEYELKLIEKISDDVHLTWGAESIIIDGSKLDFKIKKNLSPLDESQTCNCIAFRLDDVQDYWLTKHQQAIINVFENHNAGLTLGVVGKWNGDDQKNVAFINEKLSKNPKFELANHGWEHENLLPFDYDEQYAIISNSHEKINSVFGKYPKVFIPPENVFTKETSEILKNLNYTGLSSSKYFDRIDTPHVESLNYFPHHSATAYWDIELKRMILEDFDKTYEDALNSYVEHGYAVVMIHPQEFAIYADGGYSSELNYVAISNLDKLLDRFSTLGLELVSVGDIELN